MTGEDNQRIGRPAAASDEVVQRSPPGKAGWQSPDISFAGGALDQSMSMQIFPKC
jgi:hypothetical protein